jgi:dihydroorotase
VKPQFRELFLGKKELTIQADIVFRDGVRTGWISLSKGKGLITGVGELDERSDRIGSDRIGPNGSGSTVSGRPVADVVLEDGLLFPGFVDLHVHAREDATQQWAYKETYISAAKAALAGGVTAFADMPNTPEPVVEDEGYTKKHRLTRYSGMDVLPYAGIGPGTRPLKQKAPYKLFMAKSIGDLCFSGEKELKETLEHYRGQQVSFHCEDPEILAASSGEEYHQDRRPAEAEIIAVEKAIELIREFELRGTLCHISTRGAIELVRNARRKDGMNIAMEAAPHHLLLEDNGDGITFPDCLPITDDPEHSQPLIPDGWFQVNPPIREPMDRRAMLEAFSGGEFDFLATDHAPHTIKEKQEGMSGIPHLDSYGHWAGCLLESGVKPQILALAASYRPGEFMAGFGYPGRELEAGGQACFTGLTRKMEQVSRDLSFSKAGWNPMEGRTVPWSIEFTVLKGRGWKRVIGE